MPYGFDPRERDPHAAQRAREAARGTFAGVEEAERLKGRGTKYQPGWGNPSPQNLDQLGPEWRTHAPTPTASSAVGFDPRGRLDEAHGTSPRVAGTPTHLLTPNDYRPGGRTLDPRELSGAIARGTARDRAGLAPGGMGTYSYTQDAQRSAPMYPITHNPPPVAPQPIDPRERMTREERIADIEGQYGTPGAPAGSVRVPSWDEEIVRQYPEIGKPGSAANAAFLEAFRANPNPAQAAEIARRITDQQAISSMIPPPAPPVQQF